MTYISETLPLPARPNLEHLRKEAKQRLIALRGASEDVQLTEAQLLVARRYGFSSWRAMKQEVERRAPISADKRPLSIVFRPQSPGNMRERFPALHNPVELELSFFRMSVGMIGLMQAMTVVGFISAMLH